MLQQLWTHLYDLVAGNQFLAGGFVLGTIAAVLHQLKAIPAKIWYKIKSLFFIEVTVTDRDEAFFWMVRWLAAHPYSQNRARCLMAMTRRPDRSETRDTRPCIVLSPAKGHHWFFYNKRLVFLYRGSDEDAGGVSGVSDDKKSPLKPETISIRVLARNRNVIKQLLEDARELCHPKGARRTAIMTWHYNEWRVSLRARPRPIESVILRKGMLEEIIGEIEKFQQGEDWYVRLGIPYRLGILYIGPPGSGKSSSIAAIASHFDMDLGILNLAAGNIDDDDLRDMLSNVPDNTIILIEDIDCVFDQREASDDKDNRLTFSGLLNAIDGVAAGEGRILVMTTNHPEKLDPALIRPGRADLKYEIGHPDNGQVCRMFERFYPEATDYQTLRFVEAIATPAKTSMAALQGLLTKYKTDPDAAIKHAQQIFYAPEKHSIA